MPDLQSMTYAASLAIANAAKTALASAKLLLWKSGWQPTAGSVLADYAAHEADFDGYARVTVTAMLGPFLSMGGWSINTPLPAFTKSAGPTTNEIGGMALIDSTNNVWSFVVFDTPIVMSLEGQSIQRPMALVFPVA
jgi:hypothetical protein